MKCLGCWWSCVQFKLEYLPFIIIRLSSWAGMLSPWLVCEHRLALYLCTQCMSYVHVNVGDIMQCCHFKFYILYNVHIHVVAKYMSI